MRRIVYLGGLGRGEELSRHLASRQEVGRIAFAGMLRNVARAAEAETGERTPARAEGQTLSP